MLKELVTKNRSYRGYDPSRKVTEEELRSLVELTRAVPSGGNLQPLCYRLVTDPEEAAKVCANVRFGAALPELHLPFPGTEPGAFILICVNTALGKNPAACGIDVGIAAQTMLLAAVEMGLGGLMIGNFKRAETAQLLDLPQHAEPMLLLAIGKPAETIVLEDAVPGKRIDYYRDEKGVHHVPKRPLKDILL